MQTNIKMKKVFIILFLISICDAQKSNNSYSFSFKEVLAFKNRIKDLEKKDSLNNILIKKMENRIIIVKNELSQLRLENARLSDRLPPIENKGKTKLGVNYGIDLISAVMCNEVEEGAPVDISKKFKSSSEKTIYCFSRLNNYYESTSAIYHRWYFGSELKAKVRIRLSSGQNRLGISKRTITNSETGRWRVEIITADQKVLQILSFEVV